ncbi:hypothetical protein HPB48_003190 [Haemaphysalis longicornis]|uniref:CCHC-type domain-containing protein n=1 Tax=Haemaphysalis longicornis TaxID=44386 RepID=A0A9J6GU04_HAELO|nr:hypothetical protein HPB48_003190 [Haemaphysalis longicornis]
MRNELGLLTQHPEESLLEYLRAMQQLYEGYEPAAADAYKVSPVCRRFHEQFRPHLRGRSFPKLEASAQEARIVQADFLVELRYRLPPRPGESLETGCAWSGAPVPSAHQAETMAVRQETTVTNFASLRALDPCSYEQSCRSRLGGRLLVPPQNGGFRGQGGGNSVHANSSGGNNAGVGRGQQDKKARLCWFCHNPGRFSRQCPENMRSTQVNYDFRRR